MTAPVAGTPPTSAAVPPWLYLWMPVFLLFVLPSYLPLVIVDFRMALAEPPFGGWFASLMLVALALLGALPPLVLLLGLASSLAPRWQANRIERRYRLTEPSPDYPSEALREVLSFLGRHAPKAAVKVNLANLNDTALVYPTGYSSVAVAVFGGLLVLWRRQRAAAEGILLHEVAHLRQGEVLLIHSGAPLVRAVRTLPWLVVVVVVFQFVLAVPLSAVTSWSEFQQLNADLGAQAEAAGLPADMVRGLGMPLGEFIQYRVSFFFTSQLSALALGAVTITAWSLAVWVTFVGAIWCLEFNADRYAILMRPDSGGAWQPAASINRGSRWRRLHRLVTHPPLPLRRLMLSRAGDASALVCLLLLFPAALLAQLALLLLWGTALSWSIQLTAEPELWLRSYFTSQRLMFGSMALLVALWPALAPRFELLVAGAGGEVAERHRAAYWLAGAILLVLALLA